MGFIDLIPRLKQFMKSDFLAVVLGKKILWQIIGGVLELVSMK